MHQFWCSAGIIRPHRVALFPPPSTHCTSTPAGRLIVRLVCAVLAALYCEDLGVVPASQISDAFRHGS